MGLARQYRAPRPLTRPDATAKVAFHHGVGTMVAR